MSPRWINLLGYISLVSGLVRGGVDVRTHSVVTADRKTRRGEGESERRTLPSHEVETMGTDQNVAIAVHLEQVSKHCIEHKTPGTNREGHQITEGSNMMQYFTLKTSGQTIHCQKQTVRVNLYSWNASVCK